MRPPTPLEGLAMLLADETVLTWDEEVALYVVQGGRRWRIPPNTPSHYLSGDHFTVRYADGQEEDVWEVLSLSWLRRRDQRVGYEWDGGGYKRSRSG